MAGKAALFIIGMAAGIALHRAIMGFAMLYAPDSLCAYCKWKERRKSRRKKRQL